MECVCELVNRYVFSRRSLIYLNFRWPFDFFCYFSLSTTVAAMTLFLLFVEQGHHSGMGTREGCKGERVQRLLGGGGWLFLHPIPQVDYHEQLRPWQPWRRWHDWWGNCPWLAERYDCYIFVLVYTVYFYIICFCVIYACTCIFSIISICKGTIFSFIDILSSFLEK